MPWEPGGFTIRFRGRPLAMEQCSDGGEAHSTKEFQWGYDFSVGKFVKKAAVHNCSCIGLNARTCSTLKLLYENMEKACQISPRQK